VTSERSEVLMQKLFNKIKVFVCVVYTVIKEYKEERDNTQRFIVVPPMWVSPLLTVVSEFPLCLR